MMQTALRATFPSHSEIGTGVYRVKNIAVRIQERRARAERRVHRLPDELHLLVDQATASVERTVYTETYPRVHTHSVRDGQDDAALASFEIGLPSVPPEQLHAQHPRVELQGPVDVAHRDGACEYRLRKPLDCVFEQPALRIPYRHASVIARSSNGNIVA